MSQNSMEKIMRDIRISGVEENEIDTILAEDIDFTGVLSFKKPLMIKGRFKGEIKATSDLYIGEKSSVQAKVEAGKVSVKGKIQGDIIAHSRVELFSTARVHGDLITPDLVIESGCRYDGRCAMDKQKDRRSEGGNEK
jgi:cytoskeletal protein CcmA (bactofilin family)